MHWRLDSLYVSCNDMEAFTAAYADIFCGGTYNSGKRGPLDLFGINYYTNEQVQRMIHEVQRKLPPDWQTLLHWLEAGKDCNGLYLLGE